MAAALLLCACTGTARPTPSGTSAGTHQTVVLTVVIQAPPDPSPGGQAVWLRNDSQRPQELRCWRVRSLVTQEERFVALEEPLQPGRTGKLVIFYHWLRATEQLQLIDADGQVVDQTPTLPPPAGDHRIWFRSSSGPWQPGVPADYLPNGERIIHGDLVPDRPAGC